MTANNQSPVKIELGAKVSAELKAEVPKESIGRTLDALVDIIRPFTEARGLKADNIRLQRAEVAYKIAKISRETAELERVELKAPPLKFMVPFLEKASVEDADEELHSRWAALLLSASTHYGARHLTFMDILTRVSSDELKLLEDVCLSQKNFPETYHPDGHMMENRSHAEGLCRAFRKGRALTAKELYGFFNGYLTEHPLHYGGILHGRVYCEGHYYMLYSEYGIYDSPLHRSLEILEREKLVIFNDVEVQGTAVIVRYFDVTFLGVKFVRDASLRGREATARHAEEVKKKIIPRHPQHSGGKRV